ncbi:MAG: glycine zipper 2TM domain-containing protein [Gemmatimonadales bacterium]
MLTRTLAAAALAGLLSLGCGRKDGASGGPDSLPRDLSLAPVDSSAVLNDMPAPSDSNAAEAPAPEPAAPPAATTPRPRPSPASPPSPPPASEPSKPAEPANPPASGSRTHSVSAGTTMALTASAEFGTKTHKVGETVKATVAADVTDESGNVVVPAGATVTLVIAELVVSENSSDSGKIALQATQVAFGGETYDLRGNSTKIDYALKGRGVKAGDAAKVGAGAAAGAVIGRVLSGKKKGAVVGGVIGAAAGTAAAANTADRDIVVAQGARIVIRLGEALETKA